MGFLIVFPFTSFAATIETDRTWYLAGEVMKVSITDDDAQIAYAELCDTQGLTAGIVVGLQQGKGSGQKTYRYDGTDWTVVTTTETQVTNPFTKQVTVRKTVSYTAISGAGTETISAGCGFLYGCVASGKTLVWD